MSTRIENYLIYGIKFGEDFTEKYWEKEFYPKMEWNKNKPKDNPFFITDGMNGLYTFFGFIIQLSDGWNDPEEIIVNLSFTKVEIISKLLELYPDIKIDEDDIKLYYLPHYV